VQALSEMRERLIGLVADLVNLHLKHFADMFEVESIAGAPEP
jgi:hypothetical protein